MPESYTRQSTFSNGDIIDAGFFNAEFDQLVAAFGKTNGHDHSGAVGAGAPIPSISSGTTGVFIDVTVPLEPKINFKVLGTVVHTIDGTTITDTEFITHTPDGESEVPLNEYLDTLELASTSILHTPDGESEVPLNEYLDTLEVAVGDASTDAAIASEAADRAETAAMSLGVPLYIADAGTYVIPESAESADLVYEGDGTLTLPSVLIKGSRFTARLKVGATGKTVSIPTSTFTVTGPLQTLDPGDTLVLEEGDAVVLEAISTTELEVI